MRNVVKSILALTCVVSSTVVAQEARGSIEIAANEIVRLGAGSAQEIVPVYIRGLRRSEVLDVTLQVSVEGRDLTAVLSPRHETPLDHLSRTNRSGRGYRLDLFAIEFSALDLGPGDRIGYRASVSGAGFETFDTASAVVVVPEPVDECVQACVCSFLQEIGVDRDDNGRVRFAVGLTGADIETAEANLRSCLADCDPPVDSIESQLFECMDADGDPLVVRIDLEEDGSGDDAYASGLSSSGGADVVVAIGGDAAATGSNAGGNATASANKSGAASLAVGGHGGGNASSPGNGGFGKAASSSSSGGDSSGVGGDGGNGQDSGGNGGEGTGTTGCPGATGYGQGGDGGDPIDNTETGGLGGNGIGTRGGVGLPGVGAGQSGGNPVDPGEHGEGGWGRSDLGMPGVHNGTALSNV